MTEVWSITRQLYFEWIEVVHYIEMFIGGYTRDTNKFCEPGSGNFQRSKWYFQDPRRAVRSDNELRTLGIKYWNWRRNSTSINIWRERDGLRYRIRWCSVRDRLALVIINSCLMVFEGLIDIRSFRTIIQTWIKQFPISRSKSGSKTAGWSTKRSIRWDTSHLSYSWIMIYFFNDIIEKILWLSIFKFIWIVSETQSKPKHILHGSIS